MNNEEKILAMLEEMRSDITELKTSQEEMRSDIAGLKTSQEEMQSDIAGIREKLEEVDQRSIRTQELLGEVDQRSRRTAVLLETEVADKLQLLFEGHQTILDTLAPKSRVEVLEDDVGFLKTVVKAMSQEIAELKKAQ